MVTTAATTITATTTTTTTTIAAATTTTTTTATTTTTIIIRQRARVFTRVPCGRWFLLRATECCILQGFLMFTCKSSNFQLGHLGGKLLVVSRILTVQRMAMCCGPVCLQPWMPCMGGSV